MTNLFNGQIETAAGTFEDPRVDGFGKVGSLTITYRFTYGSGGTSVDVYVQTSIDGGITWWDIACTSFSTSTGNAYQSCTMSHISTPVALTDGTLTANTSIAGLLGPTFRTKRIVTGAYGGTSLIVDIHAT